MADLEEFSRRIGVLAARVEEGVSRTVRRAALAADAAVVLATPVDTGRARSNWIASVNEPFPGTVEPYAPGEASSGPAIEQAAAAVAEYGPGDHAIYITNNLPYIGSLNEGSSAQAPANFVEQAVQAGVAEVRGARVLVDEGE